MKRKKLLLGLALLGFAFISCNDSNNDSTPPTIELIAPTEDSEYPLGGTIDFEANFSGNVELNRYKVDIHSASGHQHSTGVAANTWTFQKEFDLNGKMSAHVQENFAIPANVQVGEYHLVVYCTDKAGNENITYTDIILVP